MKRMLMILGSISLAAAAGCGTPTGPTGQALVDAQVQAEKQAEADEKEHMGAGKKQSGGKK